MPVIIDNIKKSFGTTDEKKSEKGEKTVFSSLSMTFPDSGIISLMGPSGCGKTTLLRMIAGLETPDLGKIDIQNKKISFVFQEPRLFNWLTAIDNVILPITDKYKPNKQKAEAEAEVEKAEKILSLLGLENDMNKYPNELSGGMKRRIALARSLAYGGDIYIMDEPFTGLDSELKNSVFEVIGDYCASSLCIIATHDIEDAKKISDSVIMFSNITDEYKII